MGRQWISLIALLQKKIVAPVNKDNKQMKKDFDKWKKAKKISNLVQLVAFQRGGYEPLLDVLNQYHFL